jgi:hypothetical protein
LVAARLPKAATIGYVPTGLAEVAVVVMLGVPVNADADVSENLNP